MRKRIKCAICGEKFTPTSADRYTAIKEYCGTGIIGAFGSNTPSEMYDAFDCPACGTQIIAGERLPRLLGDETIDTEEDDENV